MTPRRRISSYIVWDQWYRSVAEYHYRCNIQSRTVCVYLNDVHGSLDDSDYYHSGFLSSLHSPTFYDDHLRSRLRLSRGNDAYELAHVSQTSDEEVTFTYNSVFRKRFTAAAADAFVLTYMSVPLPHIHPTYSIKDVHRCTAHAMARCPSHLGKGH